EYEKLVALEKTSAEIFNRTNSENWAVNANVHYNKWADFTLADFKPVVETFQDLYSVFRCDNCNGLLHLTMNGPKAEAIRCNCGNVNWNLNGI
ncbi:MAG: chromosome segregation protein SMC, partial [Methanobacterium sp.]